MTLEQAPALVAGQRLGVLVTLRRSGRPQTSNVAYAVGERQVTVSQSQDQLLVSSSSSATPRSW